MTTKRAGSPYDLCNSVFADGRACCMPSIPSLNRYCRSHGGLRGAEISPRSLSSWPTFAKRERGRKSAIPLGMTEKAKLPRFALLRALATFCHPERSSPIFSYAPYFGASGCVERDRGTNHVLRKPMARPRM